MCSSRDCIATPATWQKSLPCARLRAAIRLSPGAYVGGASRRLPTGNVPCNAAARDSRGEDSLFKATAFLAIALVAAVGPSEHAPSLSRAPQPPKTARLRCRGGEFAKPPPPEATPPPEAPVLEAR